MAQTGNTPASAVQEPTISPEKADESRALASEDTMLIVTFMLADQIYGGDILQVQEVTGMSHITRVPHVKPYIRGVINLRGNIVPTLDLRARFGLSGGDDVKHQQIMIARTDHGLIGYIVDAVREVINVQKSSIEPTPEGWLDASHKYFAGIAKLDESLVTLIDFNKMIQKDQVLLDEIGEE